MTILCKNHSDCIKKSRLSLELACVEEGTKLTEDRKTLLELICRDHKPTKAYDLLERFRQYKKTAKPIQVYRILNFLLERGLVHKLHSQNSYLGCSRPGRCRGSKFFICDACSDVTEIDIPLSQNIAEVMPDYRVEGFHLEVYGRCKDCLGK